MSSRRCLDCFYLFKSAVNGGGKEYAFAWKTQDRKRGSTKGDHWASFCYKKVWNKNRSQVPKLEIDAEVSKKRKRKECPFFEYRCGLETHEVEEHQRSQKTWWQRIPKFIWAAIVVAGVVLSYVADVVGLFESEWIEENVKPITTWLSQFLGQEK